MNLDERSLSTSSSIAFYLLGKKLFFFCRIGLYLGSTFSLQIIISGGTPSISDADQAKMSELTHKKGSDLTPFFLWQKGSDLTDFAWSSSNGKESSYLDSSPLFFGCLSSNYSVVDTLLDFCTLDAIKKYHRANYWSLRISPTLFLVEKYMRRHLVEMTASN